ncbi:hypothetical protein [Listeria costaricensis]|uniref:hypothetical protein n=1 Tax=Listeria costaricensis TaxID=2026604 RepID=UPI000C08B8AE|nr:hypothetical protein [Listeria costaricensis]
MDIKISEKELFLQNGKKVTFSHEIRQVEVRESLIIVLLSIPYSDNTVNNILAISFEGAISWIVENENANYPTLPYEQMIAKSDTILATDFYGRRSYIDIKNGIVIKREH